MEFNGGITPMQLEARTRRTLLVLDLKAGTYISIRLPPENHTPD